MPRLPHRNGSTGPALGRDEGSWYNAKTDQTLRPDTEHEAPEGFHWDYKPAGIKNWYRWYPDGRVELKKDRTVPAISAPEAIAFKELRLGQPGIDYVGRCLESETSFLQDVRRQSFRGGSVFAVVPEGTDLERALNFKRSLSISEAAPDAWLANRMIALSRANPRSVIVFDEPWGGRRDSPAVVRRTAPKFFHRNFVYHFVVADKVSAQTIDAAMRAGGGFLFIAAFVEYPFTADAMDADGAIDDGMMQKLAENVREIYVSAYDHDSYVVWQR